MKKNEFIKNLEEELSTSFSKSEINKQLDYYSKYIDDEIKNGKTEEEVLSELGDPRLIVKTLKTVRGKDAIVVDNDASSDKSYNGYDSEKRTGKHYYQPIMGNNSTIGCIIFILIAFIICASILRVMGALVAGTAGLFLGSPILFILLIIILINIFKNRK